MSGCQLNQTSRKRSDRRFGLRDNETLAAVTPNPPCKPVMVILGLSSESESWRIKCVFSVITTMFRVFFAKFNPWTAKEDNCEVYRLEIGRESGEKRVEREPGVRQLKSWTCHSPLNGLRCTYTVRWILASGYASRCDLALRALTE